MKLLTKSMLLSLLILYLESIGPEDITDSDFRVLDQLYKITFLTDDVMCP